MTLDEIFETRVQPEPNTGCWLWTGNVRRDGYGRISIAHNRQELAHRLFYEQSVGPIPPGLQIDHLCRQRSCVNPRHLEVVTQQINLSRGYFGTKTHCPRGHEYTEKNTYKAKTKVGVGITRKCRACHIARQSERQKTDSEVQRRKKRWRDRHRFIHSISPADPP